MQSKATTVDAYLAELPADRRDALQAVRSVVLKNLDKDYAEVMAYGMIGYVVPHTVFPAGYHCDPLQPLLFVALASQKNHMALYLSGIMGDEAVRKQLEAGWKKSGKKLEAGKSCIRFKKLDELPLDVIGDAVARIPARKHVARYVATREVETKKKTKRPAAKSKP